MPTTSLTLRKPLTPREALDAAINDFYRRCQAKNLSRHTLEYYRFRFEALNHFLERRGLELAPGDFTSTIIRDFLADEATRISPLTAQHSFVTLRCLFRFLEEEGAIVNNPMKKVQSVKQKCKLMTTFDVDGLQAMLESAGNDFTGLRLRAMLLLLADTGIRVSELCGLTLADVSLDSQTCKVTGKGNKERLVAYGKFARQTLQAYLSRRGEVENRDRLFVTCYGKPLTRQRVHRLLAECGVKAGLAGVTPHGFRRYFAATFIRAGGDCFVLQRALGHSSLEMSRRYCGLASVDVLVAQRRYCSSDMLPQPKITSGRKRMK